MRISFSKGDPSARAKTTRVSQHPQAPHAEAEFQDERSALESPLARLTLEDEEAATSNHVIRMIDFFFAFVLSQGVLRFRDTVAAPWDAPLPALLALLTLLYVVVRSFIGWHMAIEERRYRLYSSHVRTTELWRVYIDVAIVLLYAYFLNNAVGLQTHPGHDIAPLLWGFPLLFALYAAWGKLRRVAWGPDDFQLKVLRTFCLAYMALAAIYSFAPTPFEMSRALGNDLALSSALALMVAYRGINFWQGIPGRPTKRLRLPSFKPLGHADESSPATDR